MTGRLRALLGRPWLLATAGVLVAVAVVGRAVVVERSAAEAERQRIDAEAASVGADSARRSTQQQVDDLLRSIEERRTELSDTERTAAERQAAKGLVDGQVAELRGRLDELQRALELGQQLSEVQQQRRQVLVDCLLTVTLAQGLFTTGRADEAVSVLRDGAETCHRAQDVLDDVDTGSDYAYDFPDPFVLVDGAVEYAYGTNGTGGAVQVLRGDGAGGWQLVGSALGTLPEWSQPGLTWAPSVLRVGNEYLLYYTTVDRGSGQQCLSVAIANRPEGPFGDGTLWPIVCQRDLGGSIDPSPHRAPDGSLHLVWKSEGETIGDHARIWSQRLSADGHALIGAPTMLLEADQPWESGIVEGPSMATVDGRTVLLYSGGRWDTDGYAIGQAACDGPAGPCRKLDGPVLRSAGPLVGPGGGELSRRADGTWQLAFHAWAPGSVGRSQPRRLHVDPVTFDADGRLVLA